MLVNFHFVCFTTYGMNFGLFETALQAAKYEIKGKSIQNLTLSWSMFLKILKYKYFENIRKMRNMECTCKLYSFLC